MEADTLSQKAMRTWRMHAHLRKKYFWHCGDIRYVKMCGSDPIHQIKLTENSEGQYFGWIDYASDGNHGYTKEEKTGIPTMIWPHESLFSMCFPYGYKIEQDHGKGYVVRMDVEDLGEEK